SDTLPAGTSFVSLDSSGAPGWTCTLGALIQCGAPTITPATPATFVVVVTVGSSITGTITNTVTTSSGSHEADATNNTSTATDRVVGNADLAVTKTHTPDPVTPGTIVTYTITATNNGPSDATSVLVSDTI